MKISMFKYLNIAIGFLAGGVAALLVGVYVLPRFSVAEEGTRVSVRSRDLEIDADAFSHRAARSVVTFARAGDLVASTGGKILPDGKARGAGAWLTADGWVVSFTGATAGRDAVALTSDGRALPIERRIVDEATGVVFVKMSARDESAAPLGGARARVGETVYLVPARGSVVVRRVVAIAAPGGTESSDELARRITLDGALPDVMRGAPLWNARAEAVAIFSGGASAVAIGPVARAQESIFRNGAPARAAPGIKGIDLAAFAVPPAALAGKRGFLVAASRQKEIKPGDLITAVGDVQLDGALSLFEVLLDYRPADEADFSVLRGGAAIQVTIKF